MNYKTGELARYILNYCSDLLTETEKLAYKNMLVLKKIENADSPKMKERLRKSFYSTDEKATKLLENGEEEFLKKLVERVLRDNSKKDFMNLCPKCGYLARTSTAKQCRKCFHSWHDK